MGSDLYTYHLDSGTPVRLERTPLGGESSSSGSSPKCITATHFIDKSRLVLTQAETAKMELWDVEKGKL